MSVHQRLGSAKREGPREGGSEPEEAKHPGALPPLVPKQEGVGPWLRWLGGRFQIRRCPKSKGPGSVYDGGLGWIRPSWARRLCLDSPNQKQRHAEIRFIDKINSLNLNPSQSYKIICYITWSPCPNCASELVDFITRNDHLNLQIFASRLYFHWIKPFCRGLQQLQKAGISVAVMTHTEFEDCWEQFVDNQLRPFQPWDKLEQYSASIRRRLQRILTAPT
ncbi:DNA dC-_dU-editing enzyme APOBEC-3F isoform X2 [Ovis aries]|nr:DNA dC->dU-editing enzyme APOBEC-3F isoform X2 [Ovis aries]